MTSSVKHLQLNEEIKSPLRPKAKIAVFSTLISTFTDFLHTFPTVKYTAVLRTIEILAQLNQSAVLSSQKLEYKKDDI